jgi:multiple antibiotic resistance protein
MGRVEGLINGLAIIAMLSLCLVLTFVSMLTADWLLGRLGKTGADVVGRISGVLLAALAVQFVLDGVRAAI